MQRFILDVGAATDVGKQRKRNEDSVSVFTPPTAEPNPSQLGGLLLVADGMGGERAGDRASQMTAERLEQWFVSGSYRAWPEHAGDAPLETTLVRAVRGISHEIYELGEADETIRGLGSTVVLALLAGRRLVVAHVGDSRAYLVRSGAIRQITTDHSWVQRQVEVGMITAEDARRHPQRNILTRSLGDSLPPEVDVGTLEVEDGDLFVLCSDGLTGGVTDEEILAAAERGLEPDALAVALVEQANDQDGSDNITVAVGRCRLVSGLLWQERETGPIDVTDPRIAPVDGNSPTVEADGFDPERDYTVTDTVPALPITPDPAAETRAAGHDVATDGVAKAGVAADGLAADGVATDGVAASRNRDGEQTTLAFAEGGGVVSGGTRSFDEKTLEGGDLAAAFDAERPFDDPLDSPLDTRVGKTPADEPVERTLFSRDRVVDPPPVSSATDASPPVGYHDGETEIQYYDGDTEIDLVAPTGSEINSWRGTGRAPVRRASRRSKTSWATWLVVALLALAAGLLVGYLLGQFVEPEGTAPAVAPQTASPLTAPQTSS